MESLGPLKFSMRKSTKSLPGSDVPTESSGVFESSKDVKVEEPKAMPKLQAMMKRSKPSQLPVGVLPAKNKLPVTEVKTDLFLPTKESETLSSTSDHTKGLLSHPHPIPSSDSSDLQAISSIISSGQLVPSGTVDKSVVLSNNISNKAHIPGTNLPLKASTIPNLMSLNIQPLHHSVPIVATRNLIHAHATDPTLVQASIPPTAGMQFVNPQKFRSAQMIATPLIANPAVANQSQQNEETPKSKNGRRHTDDLVLEGLAETGTHDVVTHLAHRVRCTALAVLATDRGHIKILKNVTAHLLLMVILKVVGNAVLIIKES
ncbi:hypothetical protein Smp_116360 [Schistosoma mansoni]|uniref:hypothetical protein n=1 Tax=Schistosoma mansoni TaxID=6183 RepID=UPI00019B381C|nr:hypothetical protein Smp_116360 [Schistosoma mansoni]|eukprot:XP_018644090.1 hypothetical protein Smp_116360 [Schistosoma mansoni]